MIFELHETDNEIIFHFPNDLLTCKNDPWHLFELFDKSFQRTKPSGDPLHKFHYMWWIDNYDGYENAVTVRK